MAESAPAAAPPPSGAAPSGVALAHVSDRINTTSIVGRLQELGCPRCGRWRMQLTYFQPLVASVGLEELSLLHFSDQPKELFLATQEEVMQMGIEHAHFLESLQTHAQRVKATCEGSVYACGDFLVRIGPLFMNARVSGTLVEVEYLPTAATAPAAPLLAEFLQSLLGGGSDWSERGEGGSSMPLPPQPSAWEGMVDGKGAQGGIQAAEGRRAVVFQYVAMLRGLNFISTSNH